MIKFLFLFILIYILYRGFTFFLKNSIIKKFNSDSNSNDSINVDKKLFKEDIDGSIAHTEMLFRQKIISFKVKNKIIYGLNKIEKEIKVLNFIRYKVGEGI